MPTYAYTCAACGPFTAVRKMADFDQPAPCPACAAASARSFGVPDSLAAGRRSLRASGEAVANAGRYPRMRHAGNACACCP
ncbi:MAG: zinc ribbon domain-containing protein [Polaromonas sp.]|nr:zinc ribbon domain-containing protein [Polaromonas sp.]